MAADTMVVTCVSMIVSQAWSKALLNRRRRRLAVAQLFANTLEDQHVGVDAHAYRENQTGNSGQSERGPAEAEESEQNDQVQDQARSWR